MASRKQQQYERAYQDAMDIIDQEWLQAGVSQEELDQGKRLAELFDRLLASGRSANDISAEWQGKTVEEIMREYGCKPDAASAQPVRGMK
jgi:hypothetical protein